MVLPIKSYKRISSEYGYRKDPCSNSEEKKMKMHRGIDLAAPVGTPVYAAADGVIKVCARKGDAGRMVKILHPDGSQTLYMHLSNFSNIKPNMPVKAGQTIGFVGSTGRSTGAHLHFEMRDKYGNHFNPMFMFDNNAKPPQNKCDIALFVGNSRENNLAAQKPAKDSRATTSSLFSGNSRKSNLAAQKPAKDSHATTSSLKTRLANAQTNDTIPSVVKNRSESLFKSNPRDFNQTLILSKINQH